MSIETLISLTEAHKWYKNAYRTNTDTDPAHARIDVLAIEQGFPRARLFACLDDIFFFKHKCNTEFVLNEPNQRRNDRSRDGNMRKSAHV